MNSLLLLIVQLINLYQLMLIIYIILSWLLNFNVINSSNKLVYLAMDTMHKLCSPSLNFVRKYVPTLGAIDLSPVIVYIGLWFLKNLLIEYWPR